MTTWHHRVVAGTGVAAIVIIGLLTAVTPVCRGDTTAYLVNVTVRPGYNFANADDAIRYGQGVCDKIGHGQTFSGRVADVKRDFNTNDDYQASYLVSQSINELWPVLIWQLRHSAAGFHPQGAP